MKLRKPNKLNAKQIAIREGKDRYYTGKPCKRGHVCFRYVDGSYCIECCETKHLRKIPYDKKWKNHNLDFRKQQIIGKIKAQAKFKSIPFDITVNDLIWKTHCPILGVELVYFPKDKQKAYSVSIDRINPKLGYIKGNVSVISVRANSIKSDMTIIEVRQLLNYMENHDKIEV